LTTGEISRCPSEISVLLQPLHEPPSVTQVREQALHDCQGKV